MQQATEALYHGLLWFTFTTALEVKTISYDYQALSSVYLLC